ncbi:hypothetical protein ACQJBY_026942 [Aegilops geniculata]
MCFERSLRRLERQRLMPTMSCHGVLACMSTAMGYKSFFRLSQLTKECLLVKYHHRQFHHLIAHCLLLDLHNNLLSKFKKIAKNCPLCVFSNMQILALVKNLMLAQMFLLQHKMKGCCLGAFSVSVELVR